jgi:hypothetical protein
MYDSALIVNTSLLQFTQAGLIFHYPVSHGLCRQVQLLKLRCLVCHYPKNKYIYTAWLSFSTVWCSPYRAPEGWIYVSDFLYGFLEWNFGGAPLFYFHFRLLHLGIIFLSVFPRRISLVLSSLQSTCKFWYRAVHSRIRSLSPWDPEYDCRPVFYDFWVRWAAVTS